MSIRYSQQKAVTVHRQTPNLEVACTWQQSLIIIVRSVPESVIIHIYISCCLEQAHLVLVTHLLKQVDRLLRADLVPSERHVLVCDLAHAGIDRIDILLCQRRAVMLVDGAEISL